VTDLVQGLKRRAQSLTEDQIAYIIRETVEVTYVAVVLQLHVTSSSQKKKMTYVKFIVVWCMDGHLTDGRTD
jgi:hypothetical protein